MTSPEPAAPAGSEGVAQIRDEERAGASDAFLDDAPAIRDFQTAGSVDAADRRDSAAKGDASGAEAASRDASGTVAEEAAAAVERPGSAPADAKAPPAAPEDAVVLEPPPSEAATPVEEPVPALRNAARDAATDAAIDAAIKGPGGQSPPGLATEPPAPRSGDGSGVGAGEAEGDDRAAPDPSTAEPANARGSRIRIEIPQVDADPIEARSLRERADAILPEDPRWVLRGAWEQSNLRENGPDFAPGGYGRNLLSIDPQEGLLRTYRVFAGGGYVAAGEYRVEIRPEGVLELRPDERRPHVFAAAAFTISGEVVEPPSEPIEMPRRWSLRDGVLEIEGRRFVRIDRAAFESVARGGAAEGAEADAAGGFGLAPTRREEGDDPPAIDFFGTSIVGRHVCYVVDVSGSMAGPRLASALAELSRSIESLPQDRFFYVLFFSGSKLVVEDRWLRAVPASRRPFLAKLSGIEAQGGTEPIPALEHAFTGLSPVPDEIHFMTDGLIPQATADALRTLNRGRVRTVVHTYAFGERASEAMLEAIAREHGGQYRFVPQ